MKKVLKSYLSCLFLACYVFASPYESLLLIEFDNLDKNKRFDHFRHHLPDIIKQSSEIKDALAIEYAGKIEPFLNGNSNNFNYSIILLGEFSINGNILDISYRILDMESWSILCSDSIQSDVNNINIINDLVLESYSENLQSILDPQIDKTNTEKNISEINSIDTSLFDEIYNALDNFSIEVDLNYSWQELNKDGNQYGDRYYKDFDSDKQEELESNSKRENTDKLMSYIDKVLSNPYNVSIGKIDIDYYGDYDEYYTINVPVSYSIKNNLIEDLFKTLPNETESTRDGTMIIRFYHSDFLFPDYMLSKFSHLNYQVAPVLFFSDNNKVIKNIFVDTWDNEFNDKKYINSIRVDSDYSFYPLFAITPGRDNLQINLDLSIIDINYSFKVPSYNVKEYSKIAIKFILKEKLANIYDSHNKKL